MKKIILIVGTLIVTSMFLSGCVETGSWIWELTEGRNDNIFFTQAQIDKAGGTAVETVFASVLDYVTVIFCYDEDMGQWMSWVNGAPSRLSTIVADRVYTVYATQNCTITIYY